MSEPKQVQDWTDFKANGRRYRENRSLTVGRFEHLERLKIRAQFGEEYANAVARIGQAYDLLNKMQFADACTLLHNVKETATHQLNNNPYPLLLIATLFINREGEDLTAWNEELAVDKINDWKLEGLDVAAFFLRVPHLLSAFTASYDGSSANTSAEMPAGMQPSEEKKTP